MVRDHACAMRPAGLAALAQVGDRLSSSGPHSSTLVTADAPVVDAEQARLRRLLALTIVRALLPDGILRRTYLRNRWHGK
jgi:hypothetical protein